MPSINSISSLSDQFDYIDMHIHMEEMTAAEVDQEILYLANSVDEKSYWKTISLANQFPNIIPTFGIHPVKAAETDISENKLEALMQNKKLVGEIGLDFHWLEDKNTYSKQRKILKRQLALIQKFNCIPSIHTKGAESEILRLLKSYQIKKSIIHWYSGPEDLIPQFLDSGCYFTIGPDIFTNSRVYSNIPLDRIFLETDNPTGMPWILGGQSSGDDIKKMYQKLSEQLNMDEQDLIKRIKLNLNELIS
jgi:TatD DNase family protein